MRLVDNLLGARFGRLNELVYGDLPLGALSRLFLQNGDLFLRLLQQLFALFQQALRLFGRGRRRDPQTVDEIEELIAVNAPT